MLPLWVILYRGAVILTIGFVAAGGALVAIEDRPQPLAVELGS